MKEINRLNSFLGFMDGKTPMRKAQIAKTLSNLTRYNGIIYDNKSLMLYFAVNEQRKPEKAENVVGHSARTESGYTKPKTEYRLWHSDGFYTAVTKTEYDFYNYCVENGFTTIEAIEAYVAEETRIKEEKQRAEKEEELREARRKKEEKAEFEKILNNGIASITDDEMELVKNIFLDINKGYNEKYCKEFIAKVKNFDFPLCREKIISLLHNDNKSSIKVFEYLTGLELPKSYKKRAEYLEKISVSDFKGIRTYKRKTPRRNEEIFYICTFSGNWNGITAEPVVKYGVDMFIYEIGGVWKLSEAKSGLNILNAESKEAALKMFDELIQTRTETEFKKCVDKAVEETWAKNGINPKYA